MVVVFDAWHVGDAFQAAERDSADEPNVAMFALEFTNYCDNYFAGRAAPMGLAPAARSAQRLRPDTLLA